MQPRRAARGRQPDNRGGLVAPESLTAGPSGQGPITAGANIDESVLGLEPDDAEGTTGDGQFHRFAHDRPRQPPPQDAMSHSGGMPDIEATHAFHTTEAPKAVEKTLLRPRLRCQIRALALERGTTVRHDSRPRCRCMVGATARMRSTARLPPLTRREASTPCSE
jgi:hypothetical protein